MGSRTRPLALIGLLLVATLAVFGGVVGFEFVDFDDNYYVTRNLHVRGGLSWSGVVWAFTTDTLMNWHPLTWLSFMLDHELFGLDPAGFHATSLLLHAANAVLLFVVLRRMSGEDAPSAWVALLFAVHPLRVESVAWISERKDVLCAFFGLLAMAAYASWARRGGGLRYAAVALLLGLGLLAKPMLVTLPLVFVLLDRWPLARAVPLRRSIAEKLPLIAVCAASAALTFSLQRTGGAMAEASELSLTARAANAVLAYAAYLGASVWPAGLGPQYPHPYLPGAGGTPPAPSAPWLALALLAAVSAAVWRLRRVGALPVGWLWFLGMLVPTIGLVQVGHQARADRYTYLPQIGLWIALVWGTRDLLRVRPHWSRPLAAVAAAAVVALAGAAWRQTAHWHDSRALFEQAVAVAPRSPDMRINLGLALQRQGELEAAAAQYRLALEVAPDSGPAHFNLAGVYAQRGAWNEAVAHYRAALASEPDEAIVHRNLASALHAGGRIEESVAQYRAAIALDPGDSLAHLGLGEALGALGDLDGAVSHLRRAVELRPDHAPARERLRYALHLRKRAAGADAP